MRKNNNKVPDRRKLTAAPKSSTEQAKDDKLIAKRQLKKMPKDKYKMKVFLESGKQFAELGASTKRKLKNAKQTFGSSYTDRLFTYGEIETV